MTDLHASMALRQNSCEREKRVAVIPARNKVDGSSFQGMCQQQKNGHIVAVVSGVSLWFLVEITDSYFIGKKSQA